MNLNKEKKNNNNNIIINNNKIKEIINLEKININKNEEEKENFNKNEDNINYNNKNIIIKNIINKLYKLKLKNIIFIKDIFKNYFYNKEWKDSEINQNENFDIITKWKILYLNSKKNLRNIEKIYLNKKEINKKLMNKIINNKNE